MRNIAEPYYRFPSVTRRNQGRYALKEDEYQVSASGKTARVGGQLFRVGVFRQVAVLSCNSLSPQATDCIINTSWLVGQPFN